MEKKDKSKPFIDKVALLYSDSDLIDALLFDHTTGKNIIWATDDYSFLGEEFCFASHITSKQVCDNPSLIVPRSRKALIYQIQRSKDKAEVFTPSWVCNQQNNQIDNAWFGKKSNRFNKELDKGWESTYSRKNPNDSRDRIKFPLKLGKTWKDYVIATRMEVSCGEAPYLTSRYDTVTGKYINPKNRIGLLDRKLRVITENTPNAPTWLYWAEKALQHTYGFEWQGDNLFLARINLLLAVVEYYEATYHSIPKRERLHRFAEIISWNIWQMDGIKCVVPETCYDEIDETLTLFGKEQKKRPCPGCRTDNRMKHNGVYSTIMDWSEQKVFRFVDIIEGGKQDGSI